MKRSGKGRSGSLDDDEIVAWTMWNKSICMCLTRSVGSDSAPRDAHRDWCLGGQRSRWQGFLTHCHSLSPTVDSAQSIQPMAHGNRTTSRLRKLDRRNPGNQERQRQERGRHHGTISAAIAGPGFDWRVWSSTCTHLAVVLFGRFQDPNAEAGGLFDVETSVSLVLREPSYDEIRCG